MYLNHSLKKGRGLWVKHKSSYENEDEWWPLGSYSNEGVPGIISSSDFQLTAKYDFQLALYAMVNKRGTLTLDKESPIVLFHAPNH